jgi:hypothetical protein
MRLDWVHPESRSDAAFSTQEKLWWLGSPSASNQPRRRHAMPNEGIYVGHATTRDALSDYVPSMTEAERRFRTQVPPTVTHGITGADLNEMIQRSTETDIGKRGFRAVTGPSRYGRSDEKRDVRDEALEHDDDCDCSDCAAANRAYGKTKDANRLAMRKINAAHHRAFNQR